MADEKVGGIYYEVGADTSGLDDAQARVTSSSKKMAGAMDTASSSSARLDTQQKKLAVGVGKANSAMGAMGRKAGQAGIQIQQFVGQVQGGFDPMAAFSMQITDFAYVLGFPLAGAVAGITAAVAGPFITALLSADEGVSNLDETITKLKSTFDETADGSYGLSKELVRLAKMSEDAARLDIQVRTSEAKKALNEVRSQLEDTFSGQTAESLRISEEDFRRLNSAISAMGKIGGATTADYKELSTVVTDLNKKYGDISASMKDAYVNEATNGKQGLIAQKKRLKAFDEYSKYRGVFEGFANEMVPLVIKGIEVTEMQERLNDATNNFDELLKESDTAVQKRTDELDKLIDSIVREGEAAGKTTTQLIEMHRAEALAAAAALGADEAQRKAINSAFDRIAAEEAKSEAIKAAREAEQEAAKQAREAEQEAAKQAREAEQEAAKQAREQDQIGGRLEQVKASLDQEYAAYLTFHQQVEAINNAFNANMLSGVQERDALIAASAEQLQSRMARVSQRATEEAVTFQNAWNSAITRVDDVGAQAFTDTLLSTRDAGKAVQDLAKSIGRELVSSIVKFAAQWAIQQALQMTGLATYTTASVAAGATTAAAWAPAAAMVSLASFGANSAPAIAGITTTAGVAQGLSIIGGRATGGLVSAGNLYKINEHGAGEFFNDPMGGQYFMPARNGEVSTGGGGSGGVNIMFNVTNEVGNAQFTVQDTQQTADGVIIKAAVTAVAGQIASGTGEVSQALKGQGFRGTTRR